MSHAGQLADRLHQQRAVVQFARQGVEFAADHLVVDAHVARNAHVVDRELLALEDFHLHVDRVGADDDFGRFDLRHQVAVILVERLDRHVFGVVLLAVAQPLVDRLLVVGVARFDAEHALQVAGRVDRVADPCDVADIVLVALRHREVDTQSAVVDRVDRVAQDREVAVAFRVVEVDEVLLVRFVVVLLEFRRLEEVDALLVRLLEGAAQALVLELFVAVEIDLADLDLAFAVDHEGDVHGVLDDGIVLDAHAHLRIAESLLGEIFLDELRILVDHVVRQLSARFELQLLDDVLLAAFADPLAFEEPAVDARPFAHGDLHVHAVAVDRGADLDVGEQTLVPQLGDHVRDVLARQIDRIARHESRRGLYDGLVEVFDTAQVDFADEVAFGLPLHDRSLLVEGRQRLLRVVGRGVLRCGLRRDGSGIRRVLLLCEYAAHAEQRRCDCQAYLP